MQRASAGNQHLLKDLCGKADLGSFGPIADPAKGMITVSSRLREHQINPRRQVGASVPIWFSIGGSGRIVRLGEPEIEGAVSLWRLLEKGQSCFSVPALGLPVHGAVEPQRPAAAGICC